MDPDDGVPLSSYYVYDGIGEIPSDATHVRVAPSVTVIRSNVFSEDSTRRANIRKFILPEGLRVIEGRAFKHCKSLTDIIIPSSVEEMGDEAFEHCSELRVIALPIGLQCINRRTFMFCESLRNIKIPPQISTIHEGACCSNLSTAEFCHESSLRKIQSDAFFGCESLTELILPDQVEEIETNSLNGCCLANFRVPSAMTTFNLSAFRYTNMLLSIEIPERTERIIVGNNYPPTRLSGIRNIAFSPGCDVDSSALKCFESLIAGLFPDNDNEDDDDNYRQMFDLLRRRFEGLSIHRECYYQTFQDGKAVMRNLRREINPWSTQDSTIIGRLNVTGKTQDCLGMTPLHILTCSTRHTLEIYELIVQKYPENLVTRDRWGDVPLLYAFWCNAPDEIVRFLVESYKTMYPGYTFDWESMIETLAKNKVPTSRILTLIETHQQNYADQECNLQDVVARLVNSFHILTTIEIVQFLLREIASRRIEASGVGRWRIELMLAIDKICLYNQIEDPTRELYSLLDQCESLKESAGILELALWKAKLEDDDEHCHKMRKFDDDCTTVARRERCRINCGTDIVLRNVLPYISPNFQLRGGHCCGKCLALSLFERRSR